jgi:hypothetical protein
MKGIIFIDLQLTLLMCHVSIYKSEFFVTRRKNKTDFMGIFMLFFAATGPRPRLA